MNDEEYKKFEEDFNKQQEEKYSAKMEEMEREFPLQDRILAIEQMKAAEKLEKELQELEEYELTDPEKHGFQIVPWKDFKNQKFEDPKWIVENIIPERGLVAVTGSPESCKSLLTNFLAIAVAKGELIFDKFKTIQTPVLLIDQENLPAWIHKRIESFNGSGDDFPLYIFQPGKANFSLADEQIFKKILGFIEFNHVGLVIFDTFRLIHNRDENSSTDLKPVFDKIRELTKVTAVLLIQHHRKTDRFGRNKASGEEMMGSIFIRGSVDSQLTLTKITDISESVTRIRVTHTKSRYIKPIPTFELTLEEDGNGLTFVYQDAVNEDILKKDEAKSLILSLLEEQNLKRKEIIDALVSEGVCGIRTGESALAELVKEGQITHTTTKPYVYSLLEVEGDNIPQTANTYIEHGLREPNNEELPF